MYEKVLVAVDGSDPARLAVRHAGNLARLSQGSVRALYVLDSATSLVDAGHLDPQESVDAQRAEGHAMLEQASKLLSACGVPYEVEMMEDRPDGEDVASSLKRYADSWGAGVVVMGTHGRTGLRHALLGSVAERVVHLSTWPVMLIRANEQPRP